jgi:hypothetical protein
MTHIQGKTAFSGGKNWSWGAYPSSNSFTLSFSVNVLGLEDKDNFHSYPVFNNLGIFDGYPLFYDTEARNPPEGLRRSGETTLDRIFEGFRGSRYDLGNPRYPWICHLHHLLKRNELIPLLGFLYKKPG